MEPDLITSPAPSAYIKELVIGSLSRYTVQTTCTTYIAYYTIEFTYTYIAYLLFILLIYIAYYTIEFTYTYIAYLQYSLYTI